MGWGALLKAAVSLGGRAIKAVAKSAGGAVVHPQQTLKGLGIATKSAAIGGSLGYIGWEKLTTDKSVVGIVSDAVIGEETYNPQNEMFRLLGTKRSFSQNETFFFSHP